MKKDIMVGLIVKHGRLIRTIKTVGHRNPLQIVDKLSATGLRIADSDFQKRNKFKKLLEKGDLTIVESKRFYQ